MGKSEGYYKNHRFCKDIPSVDEINIKFDANEVSSVSDIEILVL